MDGPKPISIKEDMNGLNLRDLLILRSFLEKGIRNEIFLQSEKKIVAIIHTKLSNIIKEAMTRQEQERRETEQEQRETEERKE